MKLRGREKIVFYSNYFI